MIVFAELAAAAAADIDAAVEGVEVVEVVEVAVVVDGNKQKDAWWCLSEAAAGKLVARRGPVCNTEQL